MRDVVDGVNLLRLRPHDGLCDPAEPDVVQGARGVEPGLARHRRSAHRVGWILPAPQLFHFVNNVPHYNRTTDSSSRGSYCLMSMVIISEQKAEVTGAARPYRPASRLTARLSSDLGCIPKTIGTCSRCGGAGQTERAQSIDPIQISHKVPFGTLWIDAATLDGLVQYSD